VGSVVNVEFREFPKEMLTGTIASVNTTQPAEQKDGKDMYEVRIKLDTLGDRIMHGLEAVAIVVPK
jgi:hypothetical protein